MSELLLPAFCPLLTANCQLPTAHYQLPTAHYQLPTANCLLPTAHCPLPTAYCVLPTVYLSAIALCALLRRSYAKTMKVDVSLCGFFFGAFCLCGAEIFTDDEPVTLVIGKVIEHPGNEHSQFISETYQ